MQREIFDQERPKSAMARRLDDAFAGCEQWTLAPPAPKRASEVAFKPRLSASARLLRSAAQAEEPPLY